MKVFYAYFIQTNKKEYFGKGWVEIKSQVVTPTESFDRDKEFGFCISAHVSIKGNYSTFQ